MNLGSISSRYALLTGFSILLVLLVAVSVLGVTRTETVNSRLQAIIYEQDIKTGLVSTMFRTTRERSQVLYQLFNEEEAAARTRAAERYKSLGEEFLDASRKLASMPLSTSERTALDAVMARGERTREVRDELVELLFRGDMVDARELYNSSAVPAQDAFQESLYKMLESSRVATMEFVEQARYSTRNALLMIAVVGGLVLVGATFVAALVTRRVKQTEYALQLEKELAQVTLHSIGDGVITTDANANVEYLNPVAEQYTGWTTAEARGKPLSEIYRVIDERSGKAFDPLSQQPEPPPGEEAGAVSVRLVDKNGRECPIRYSHAPIRSRDEGRVLGMIVVFHDISQIRAMAQQLLWQASHDALTGLVNRREFERRLTELIDTAKQGRDHALMFMDLDNFKAVNDTCGHSAGDELLRQLTTVMLSRMRGSDTLARLGGDEFGALLESCPYEQAVRIANAMRETVREFRFVVGSPGTELEFAL